MALAEVNISGRLFMELTFLCSNTMDFIHLLTFRQKLYFDFMPLDFFIDR